MADDPSVDIGEHLGFVEAQISEGRHGSASEVVQAGLRMLEEQEAEIARLRAALIKGEESGVSDRDVLEIWAAAKQRSGAMRG